MNYRGFIFTPCAHPSSQFKFINYLTDNKETTSGNKKAPSRKRCCPETKLDIPSFPTTGGTGISIRAFEAFQPTDCLPWILL